MSEASERDARAKRAKAQRVRRLGTGRARRRDVYINTCGAEGAGERNTV